MFAQVKKVYEILSKRQRYQLLILFLFMVVAMSLEAVGIGVVMPVIAFMSHADLGKEYPLLQPMLVFFGNPDQRTLIIGSMLLLISLYLVDQNFEYNSGNNPDFLDVDGIITLNYFNKE